jgi:hypothetical protein
LQEIKHIFCNTSLIENSVFISLKGRTRFGQEVLLRCTSFITSLYEKPVFMGWSIKIVVWNRSQPYFVSVNVMSALML